MVGHSPSAHGVCITAKDLGQAAHNDVCMLQHVDIDEVSNGLVYDDQEIILICKGTEEGDVG